MDEVLLIEDWHIDGNGGKALAPGRPTEATPQFTVNRKPTLDLNVKSNQRLRLRVINGCQRAMVALKIAGHDVHVMAIDSQPAEPFVARDGQLVLAPGTRIDALIDATQPPGSAADILLHDGKTPRPIRRIVTSKDPAIRAAPLALPTSLPSTGQPARPDLRNALRVDLSLDPAASWITPARFDRSSQPAFKAKRGRTVVLALNNSTGGATLVREGAFALASVGSKAAAAEGKARPLVELPWSYEQAMQRMAEVSPCAEPAEAATEEGAAADPAG